MVVKEKMKNEKELKEEIEKVKSSREDYDNCEYPLVITELETQLKSLQERNAEVKQAIEWFYNDLQEHINKTYDGETIEITEGEMARQVMERSQLLLKELLQKLELGEEE